MAEKRYIDKSKAQKTLIDLPAELDAEAVQRCIEAIHKLSDEDVAPVRHGRWGLAAIDIPDAFGKWNVWICSECGYRRKAGWEHTEDGRKPRAKYCENCMAKMDGGVNDEAD